MTLSRRFLVLTTAVTLSICAGCLFPSDDNTTANYFPFSPGNAWYYTSSTGALDTAVIGPTKNVASVTYRTFEFPGGGIFDVLRFYRESDEGIRVYVKEIGLDLVDSMIVILGLDAVTLNDLVLTLQDPEWLFLKKLLQVNSTWTSVSVALNFTTPITLPPVNASATFTIEASVTPEKVTVPAGTFDTIRVDWLATGEAVINVAPPLHVPDEADLGSVWYAPNIGPVKIHNAATGETVSLTDWSVSTLESVQ